MSNKHLMFLHLFGFWGSWRLTVCRDTMQSVFWMHATREIHTYSKMKVLELCGGGYGGWKAGLQCLGHANEPATSTIAAVFYAISHKSTFFVDDGLSVLLSDEQMSKLDVHFPYYMASRWVTRWGLSTDQVFLETRLREQKHSQKRTSIQTQFICFDGFFSWWQWIDVFFLSQIWEFSLATNFAGGNLARRMNSSKRESPGFLVTFRVNYVVWMMFWQCVLRSFVYGCMTFVGSVSVFVPPPFLSKSFFFVALDFGFSPWKKHFETHDICFAKWTSSGHPQHVIWGKLEVH